MKPNKTSKPTAPTPQLELFATVSRSTTYRRSRLKDDKRLELYLSHNAVRAFETTFKTRRIGPHLVAHLEGEAERCARMISAAR